MIQKVTCKRRQPGLKLGLKALLMGLAVSVSSAMLPSLHAQQAAPQVLSAVPANSEIVILVPSLTGLNQKLATLNAAMGGMVPWMNDTLGEVKRNSGMLNGVNDQGGAAIVMNNLIEAADAQTEEPPFVLLMPVSDYAAFVGNFNTMPAADGLTPANTPQGQQVFLREVNGYAVMGADRDVVRGFQPGNAANAMLTKAGKLGGQVAGKSDFMILVDMGQMAPKLIPKLNEAMAMAEQGMVNNPDAANSPIDPKLVMDLYKKGITSFLQSSEMLVMGMDINELGVGLSYSAQFKPGSDMANFMKPTQMTAAQIMSGNADAPYFFAVSQNYQSIDMASIVKTITGLVKDTSPQLAGAIDAAMPLIEQTQGTSAAYYPGQMGLAGGLFNSAQVIKTADGAQYVQTFQAFLDKLKQTRIPVEMPGAAAQGGQGPNEIAFFTQYKANTTNVEGVAIDQYELRYDFPPALLAQMNPQMMMLTGMSSQRGYVAQVGNTVIITSSADLPTLTQAIQSVKNNKGLASNQGITQVRQQLTPDAQFEAYLNVGTIASTGMNMAAAFGQPIELQVPANMAPVGYSMSLSENGAAARTFVPMDVIKFTKDVAIMFGPMVGGMMAPQGGDGGGDFGGEPGPGGPPR